MRQWKYPQGRGSDGTEGRSAVPDTCMRSSRCCAEPDTCALVRSEWQERIQNQCRAMTPYVLCGKAYI